MKTACLCSLSRSDLLRVFAAVGSNGWETSGPGFSGTFRGSANLWQFPGASDGTFGVVNQFHSRHMNVCNIGGESVGYFRDIIPGTALGCYDAFQIPCFCRVSSPSSLTFSRVTSRFLYPSWPCVFPSASGLSRLSERVSNRILEV
jgi:hypothetical protein